MLEDWTQWKDAFNRTLDSGKGGGAPNVRGAGCANALPH